MISTDAKALAFFYYVKQISTTIYCNNIHHIQSE